MDEDRSLIAIDNVASGFDLYGLEQSSQGAKFKFIRTLEVGKPSKTYAKSVVFANGSQAVVTGSDHGKVYIFDRRSGRVIKKITHSKSGGVETVSVSHCVFTESRNLQSLYFVRCTTKQTDQFSSLRHPSETTLDLLLVRLCYGGGPQRKTKCRATDHFGA